MPSVRDLAALAAGLDLAAFTVAAGPVVLVQHPTPESQSIRVRAGPTTAPVPIPNLDSAPRLEKLEDLLVATLPPPAADGTMSLVIGRNPDCDLVVEDPAISGRHAALHWDGTRGVLTELGSINGTFINRQKIWTKAVLVSGDQLRIGLSTFDYLLAADFHARFKGA